MIDELITDYKNIRENCNERKLIDIKKEITKIENKKDMVLDMIMNGELSRASITYRFECYDKKIKELKDKKNIY